MSSPDINRALIPPGVGGPAPIGPAPTRRQDPPPVKGPSFAEVLQERTAPVKERPAAPVSTTGLQFSGHALQRLERRGIDLDAPTMQRLEGGVQKAAGKGSRESVVFVDDNAFVVSVKNNTVITAVDRASMREHVFTNIDSAVIA